MTGTYKPTTTCANPVPACDAAQVKCVGCSSNAQCGSGLCSGGACCASKCNGPCDTGACNSAGACLHKDPKTWCGVRPGLYFGDDDIQLFCDATGACIGPTFKCGGNTCNLTSTNVCCMTSPGKTGGSGPVVYSCTARGNCTCGDGSCDLTTNTNHRWHACQSSLDCPMGYMCEGYVDINGPYGFLFYKCVLPTDPDLGNKWSGEVCDPTLLQSQCVSGTCSSNGDDADPTNGGCR
jgi:hypothetical protein